MTTKHKYLKVIFSFSLFIALAIILWSLSLRLKFAVKNCAFEKMQADDAIVTTHIPPSSLMLRVDDLPSRLSFDVTQGGTKLTRPQSSIALFFSPSLDISNLDQPNTGSLLYLPLESNWTEYSFFDDGLKKGIFQSMYWFGTNSYAYCRFKNITSWTLTNSPALLKWDAGRNIGTGFIDAYNCYETEDELLCTWVGKYGGYVTVFSAPIGNNAISWEEFNEMIIIIDKTLENAING